MKRFSKALSLLVAAAVLMASVSTSASATAVSSVEQTSTPTVDEVTGLEDASSLEIKTADDEDLPEERKETLKTAHDTLNDYAQQSNETGENKSDNPKTRVAGKEAVQQFALVVSGLDQLISQSTIPEENLAVDILRVFDMHTDEEPTGSVDVTFDTTDMGLESGTLVGLLHWDEEKGWELIGYAIVGADGKVTFTNVFQNGNSPYAIVSISDVTVTSTKTSPQTDENVNALLIAAIALAAVASVVAVSGKKAAR